ncbi:MAG: hypothetical protein LAQ69_01355 [Acidobacteriia bacterium]|nr:hypothetical protein [Terriglobia bacterium]
MRLQKHAKDPSGLRTQAGGPNLHTDLGCSGLTAGSAVRTLYSIIYDAPGAWTDAHGHIHHGGGEPGDPVWAKLSPAARDDLTGRAIIELAALTGNREIHAQIVKAASALLSHADAAKS